MAKKDGNVIGILFSEPLINEASGNESSFTVTIPEYDYIPGGTISNVTRPVNEAKVHSSVDDSISLGNGSMNGLVLTAGRLRLAIRSD